MILDKGLSSEEKVMDLAFSPVGRRLAACTANQREENESRVVVWDLTWEPGTVRGKQVFEDRHPKIVFGVCFDHEGRWIATACNDSKGRVYDLAEGKPSPSVYAPVEEAKDVGTFYEVTFSPDHRRLAVACADKCARVWELDRKNQPPVKLPHDQGVRCVSFLDSGESLATGSYDRTVKVWKLGGANPGELLRPHNTLLGPEGTVGEIHSLREKGQIAVVSFDKTVRLYRLLPEQLIRYGPTRVTDKRKW